MDGQNQDPQTHPSDNKSQPQIISPNNDALPSEAQPLQTTQINNPPPNPIAQNKSKKLFLIIVLVLLAIISGLIIWFLLSNHKKTNGNLATGPTNSTTSSCQPKNSTTTVNNVQVKYIDMPCTLQHFKSGGISMRATAQGHYLYVDKTGYSDNLFAGGQIFYDGKPIYKGNDLDTLTMQLSQNGLHYIYARQVDPGNNDIYIDSSKVTSSTGAIPAAVSNNGKDYGYISTLSDGATLNKNSTVLYKGIKNITPFFSSDLSQYIADDQSSNGNYEIVLNGKVLLTTNDINLHEAISPSGQHYIYSKSGVVVVDGSTVGSIANQVVGTVVTTDSGQYAYAICSQSGASTVYVNLKSYQAVNCDGQHWGNLSVSDDGSHFIYGSQNYGWTLDGQKATLSGQVADTEFVNNTLYVYRWAN